MSTCQEVRHLRTEFEKVYRLRGGRYVSEVSQTPVHVDNGQGWEEVTAMPDPPEPSGRIRYRCLPYVLASVLGNKINVVSRKHGWWISARSDQARMGYSVSLDGFKSLMEIPDRSSVPARDRTVVMHSPDLEVDRLPTGFLVFRYEGRAVWSIRFPVLTDSTGQSIALKMTAMIRPGRIEIETDLPLDWLEDPARSWPVTFDPTHTSEEISVANEGTTYYTMPADREFELGTAQCHWKGVDSQSGSLTEVHNSNTGYGQGTVNTPFPSVPSGGLFDHLVSYHTWTANYDLDPDPDQVPYAFNCGNSFWGGDTYQTKSAGSWNRTSPNSYNSGKIGTNAYSGQSNWMPTSYCSFAVTAYTYYYPVNHTTNPSVITDGKDSTYTGTLLNGIWSGWQTLLGFGPGENTFSHTIGGSGQAIFQFRYPWTYKRPVLLHTAKIATPGGNVVIRLVSPTDPALQYNCLRMAIWGQIFCVDLVDTDDPEAGPMRIKTALHGILAAREYE